MFNIVRFLSFSMALTILVPTLALAQTNAIEICTLKPQQKSLMALLLEVAHDQADYATLREWTKDLNRHKDLDGKVDSYNFILPWQKRPPQSWLKTHCQYIGYVTPVEMYQQRRNWNYSIPTHQLHLRPVDIVLSQSQKKAQPQQVATKPIASERPIIINIGADEESKSKAVKKKDKAILRFGLVPFYAAEFVNGEGSGIRNEFELEAFGAEVSLMLRPFSDFYIYGKGRFSAFDLKQAEVPTQVDLDRNHEVFYELGLEYYLWDNMFLGLSYRSGDMMLFSRTVPIFNLQTYLQEMEFVHVSFGFYIFKSDALNIGFKGTYGVSINDTELFRGYDYRTLLYISYVEDELYDLSLSGGYELNKVLFDSSIYQITEINRNRYIIYLNFTQKF